MNLLDFVVRLRNFAPFKTMLLQIEKPGLRFAASAADWRERFKRWPKEGARPLLILWPFGPVALVYDVIDTDGEPLPEDVVSCFFAAGLIDAARMVRFEELLARKHIHWTWVDGGDGKAGQIKVVHRGMETTSRPCMEYRSIEIMRRRLSSRLWFMNWRIFFSDTSARTTSSTRLAAWA